MNQINQINQTNHRGRRGYHSPVYAVKKSVWRMANGTSFGLNDLEALVRVVHEAKEWISASSIELCSGG